MLLNIFSERMPIIKEILRNPAGCYCSFTLYGTGNGNGTRNRIGNDGFMYFAMYLNGPKYKARHAHKRLYTVLPKYSKIQVLPGITSCRLMKDNKQAIELNSLLINNMPEGGYG